MNKLFYCNQSGQYHYVYAKNHLSAAHKFKERFKRLFGKWNFNPHDIRVIKKPLSDQIKEHVDSKRKRIN